MICKKVRVIDNSSVDKVNMGKQHSVYTGTVVGDSRGGDWCVRLDQKGVETYRYDMFSGARSDKPNLYIANEGELDLID